ncbi:hypothetical protein IKU74_03455 [bacterium]|nr:hypothetical protein [bacterium]
MATNFDFLKSTDKNLFDIITEAEKLYRDEYFEQCMGQTRRFGEHVCKDVLGNRRTTEETFDDMLATLKDKSKGNPQEKEFLDDLYFLKKNGNKSVHGATVKKDGLVALECLQRAFEVAISYSVFKNGPSDKLMRLQYDTELMLTGKKNKSLSERYSQAKIKAQKTKSFEEKPKKLVNKTTNKKQAKKYKVQKEKTSKISLFWIIMLIAFTMSLTTIGLLMLSAVKP